MTHIRWSAMLLGLPLIAGLVTAPHASAAERKHVVRDGEYASLIAKRYFGNVDGTELLLRYNGKPDTVLHPGETVRVPYSEIHRVRRGDTWSTLAQRYVGRASTYPTIAALNGLDPRRPLQPDQTIVMPVVLEHALGRGETLAVLSERYYGEPKRARLIEAFNEIDDPRRLAVGTVIRVPLVSLRLTDGLTDDERVTSKSEAADEVRATPEVPPVEAAEADSVIETGTAPEEPAATAEFEGALSEARLSYEAAEFDTANERLSAIRVGVEERGSKAERVELWRLLAFVNVALDQVREACQAYGALADVDTEQMGLDPDFVSPKIRNTLAACQRQVPRAGSEAGSRTRLP